MVEMDDSDTSALSSPPSSVMSSPLSSPANSPSPPPPEAMPFLAGRRPNGEAYPSPPASQQTSQSGSPDPDETESNISAEKDGPPPAKRRRISRERSTEYLDLSSHHIDADQQQLLDRLMKVLHQRRKIVVIAGAGISVSAGIPDFRSSQGLFRSLKDDYKLKGSGKHLFDASVYKDDVSTSSFHHMVSSMSRLTKDAKPTAFHHMLATIADEGRLLRLYSQNVDGIDTSLEPLQTCIPLGKRPDGKWPRTVQLHGGLDKMVCSKCRDLSDFDPSLFTGPVPPLCPTCEEVNEIRTTHEGKRSHGIGRLRPRMVLYNEHNPDDEAIGTVTREDLRKRPDAVVVVGTTLKVPGVRRIVREMCGVVRDRRGGVAIWINNDPPPLSKDLEDCWDIVVRGTSDEVANRAAMRRWDEPQIPDNFFEINEQQAQQAAEHSMRPFLPHCELEFAKPEPLPSSQHVNNSFSPPLPNETPKKPKDHGPTDWSPIALPRPSIVTSIEQNVSADDVIAVTPTGLLTPSKSQRNSPVTKALPSLKEKLTGTAKGDAKPNNKGSKRKTTTTTTTTKTTTTAVPKKKCTVKYIKPSLSKSKAQTKAKPKLPAPSLSHSFKHSKLASEMARAGKDLPSSPSKLRQVSNMSPAADIMHPLSPQDPRNNASPDAIQGNQQQHLFTSTLQSENAIQEAKRKRLSVESIMN